MASPPSLCTGTDDWNRPLALLAGRLDGGHRPTPPPSRRHRGGFGRSGARTMACASWRPPVRTTPPPRRDVDLGAASRHHWVQRAQI